MLYIEELVEDEKVVEHYLCKDKKSLKAKSGKTYYSLTLQDKTGTINAKVWDLNKNIQNFEANDFIKIEGTVLVYNGDHQLKVTKIRKSREGEYFVDDYVPVTEKNIDNLHSALLRHIDGITNKYIKELLENIFIKNENIAKKIKTHSAAKVMHHGYSGGLLEHTVSIADICEYLSSHYKFVDKNILIAGALLHDVGKIYELSAFPENDYTDDGKLLGHIIMGVEIITKESENIAEFPHELKSMLKHCIIGHHGELEYGSPKLPSTLEAYVLHLADTLDSKVKMFEEHFSNNKQQTTWVGYNRALNRDMRKSKYDAKYVESRKNAK